MHARDRRRIKTTKEGGKAVNDGMAEMQDYRHRLAVKPPDIAPQSAGGLTRTNWDIEIRRRYAQALAEETLEFPTQSDLQSRIEPICYEEGLVGGCAQGAVQICAEMMEQATEAYLKELIGGLYVHTRANSEGCVHTETFRRQRRKEEDDLERGILQRNSAGLLPVEMEVQGKRQPLDMEDMRLSLQLTDIYLKQDPFLSQRMMLNRQPALSPEMSKVNGLSRKPMLNGSLSKSEQAGSLFGDAMVVDEVDVGWRGVGKSETMDLMGVLDDCLAVG